jgi:hypothetical protein
LRWFENDHQSREQEVLQLAAHGVALAEAQQELKPQLARKLERMLMTQNNAQVSLASGHSRFALGRHRKHMSAAIAAGLLRCPAGEA